MNMSNDHVVCFGELLWDILPGMKIPGGAPMNVAYHLHMQGIMASVITKIGNDEEGRRLKDIFSQRGMKTDYLEVDDRYETGKVFATPDGDNNMKYEIVNPVAWDFIQWKEEFEHLLNDSVAFVYGSLAARNSESANTLFKLLEIAPRKILDINLRPPHFGQKILEDLLSKADFLKLNSDELELISGWYGDFSAVRENMSLLSERFSIPEIALTMGAQGAILMQDGEFIEHAGYKVRVADTIGSGDAFLAGMIASWLKKRSATETLDWANKLGAYVASKQGACPEYELNDVYSLNAL